MAFMSAEKYHQFCNALEFLTDNDRLVVIDVLNRVIESNSLFNPEIDFIFHTVRPAGTFANEGDFTRQLWCIQYINGKFTIMKQQIDLKSLEHLQLVKV